MKPLKFPIKIQIREPFNPIFKQKLRNYMKLHEKTSVQWLQTPKIQCAAWELSGTTRGSDSCGVAPVNQFTG